MSGIGSIIASGVVPATQQASQVARERDKQVRQQQRAAQRTREIFEAHLQTLEENDETETNARLRADAQMHLTEHNPPQPEPGPRQVYGRNGRPAHSEAHRPNSPPASPGPRLPGDAKAAYQSNDTGEADPAPPDDSPDKPAHLDVQG
jgi:type II secretory pathway pseudopilin PulG